MSYFTEDLLESIKFRSMAPIGQSTFDDSALLSLAYEELELKLASDLITAREDFFLTSERASIFTGVSRYSVPSRAIGNAIKALFYIDQSSQAFTLKKIDVSEAYKFSNVTGTPIYFAMEGDEVTIYPTPNQSVGQIEFRFAAKPNKLVLSTDCTKITSISTSSVASFFVNTDLTASISVGSYVDFISTNSPFKIKSYKCAVLQITSSQIDVSLTSVQDGAGAVIPAVGDYVCLSGTSNIPQIPTAFHSVLAQMTAVRLLESLGDINKLQAARGTLEQMRREALALVRNRVEASPDKIRPRRNLRAYL